MSCMKPICIYDVLSNYNINPKFLPFIPILLLLCLYLQFLLVLDVELKY